VRNFAHAQVGLHSPGGKLRAVGKLRGGGGAGLRIAAKVVEGNPKRAVIEEAASWGADLIVVGSHGYTGVGRWLLGGVARAVVSHAPCSVEVVRWTLIAADLMANLTRLGIKSP
jgi:hypothetical protein